MLDAAALPLAASFLFFASFLTGERHPKREWRYHQRRIETCVASRILRTLSFHGKLLLAAAGALVFSLPATIGGPNAVTVSLTASRKVSPGFDGTYTKFDPGKGNWVVDNASLRDLVGMVYQVPYRQITGGPDWLNVRLYKFTAHAPGQTARQFRHTVQPLLRSLLAEKFKLQFHRETTQSPGYRLLVAAHDVRLHRSQLQTCPTFKWTPYPPAPVQCGVLFTGPNIQLNHTLDAADIRLSGPDTVYNLTTFLSGEVDRPVIDRTGLTGLYDLHLEWNRAATAEALRPGSSQNGARPESANDDAGPSIFTALREQLGLRLQAAALPVDMLVIDHAEKPTLVANQDPRN